MEPSRPSSTAASPTSAAGAARTSSIPSTTSRPAARALSAQTEGHAYEPKPRRHAMNWEQIEGQWGQMKGFVKSKWSKLTDDDLKNLSGKKDTLVGKLQER